MDVTLMAQVELDAADADKDVRLAKIKNVVPLTVGEELNKVSNRHWNIRLHCITTSPEAKSDKNSRITERADVVSDGNHLGFELISVNESATQFGHSMVIPTQRVEFSARLRFDLVNELDASNPPAP